MTDTLLDQGPSASAVAAYLKRHPQFLDDYPELASQLTLPRAQGAVASLASYQLQHLREKNAELEGRLAELVAVAGDNERLMQRVHAFNVAVLRAATPAQAAQVAVERLQADFAIDQVRLLPYAPVPGLAERAWLQPVDGAEALPELADVLEQQQPLTGRLGAERLERLFGPAAGTVRSAAVVPLGAQGVLALGSAAADHFQPGMGTLFLQLIGATVAAALKPR